MIMMSLPAQGYKYLDHEINNRKKDQSVSVCSHVIEIIDKK